MFTFINFNVRLRLEMSVFVLCFNNFKTYFRLVIHLTRIILSYRYIKRKLKRIYLKITSILLTPQRNKVKTLN